MGKPQTELDPFRDELRALRKALGNRIREFRRQKGWSQEGFADRAHVHRTFAGSLERGEKNISFHALILIARCFGMTVSELTEGLEESSRAAGLKQGRKPRVNGSGRRDRSRLLDEITALERIVRDLKEIAETRD